jgi:hypothetical protein
MWDHRASLNPKLYVEVPVLNQESERSCICPCVRGIYLVRFYNFSIRFWYCSDHVVLFVFHFHRCRGYQQIIKYRLSDGIKTIINVPYR